MSKYMKVESYQNQMVPEITVINFNQSLEFYTKFLGFQIRYTRSSPNFAYCYQETAQLMLEEYHSEGWNIESLQGPLGRGINLQITLKNISEIYERLIDAKFHIYKELKECSYQTNDGLTLQKEFLIQDPDGYLLRFCEKINS